METQRPERGNILDEPPKQPRHRNAPRGSGDKSSKLSSLAGRGSDKTASTPEGDFEDPAEDQSTDLDTHPIVQAFDHYGQAKAHLQIVGTLLGAEVMLPVQDLLVLLDQLIPQQASAMLSGSLLGPAPGVTGAPPPTALGGPPQMGLSQLAGVGAGAPQSQAPVTPPGAGMPGMSMGMPM